jgi:hypothetical protein
MEGLKYKSKARLAEKTQTMPKSNGQSHYWCQFPKFPRMMLRQGTLVWDDPSSKMLEFIPISQV